MNKLILINLIFCWNVCAGCGNSVSGRQDGENDGMDSSEDAINEIILLEEEDRGNEDDSGVEFDVTDEDEMPEDAYYEEDGEITYCPVPGDIGQGDHTLSLVFGGMNRSYIVHVPPSYNQTVLTPLVINLHGFTSNASQQVLFSNMNPTADAKGFIVAYPDGYRNSWNAGLCCGTAASMGIDDVGFLKAVVADISSKLCIDRKRVYATGMSNGGYMSHRLGCEASDVFAAVAPVSGAMGISPCAPPRPVPVIGFHGLQDNLVPYSSGRNAINEWRTINGCQDTVTTIQYGESSYCEIYEVCDGGVKVGFCTLDPMGHCWPGGSEALCIALIGPYNDDLNANEVMWDFFSQFSLP